jgi:urease accessory protein
LSENHYIFGMTIAPFPQPAAPHASEGGWHGQLKLDFAPGEQGTVVERAFAQTPLKFQRPFYPEGSVCHGVMLHTAGGIVGGDRLTTQICLQPQTHALLTTAAATKVYRSNGQEAQHTVHLKVAENACLEWLPQEMIVFNAAQYRQKMRVELAQGAIWMGWEITRLGRSACGEQFSSGLWRSHTEVWQQGQIIWVDPQGIIGGSEMMHSPHGLADCPVVGSFVLVGRSVTPELMERVRATAQIHTGSPWLLPRQAPENSTPDTLPQTGTTRLTRGLLCRYRGHSTLEARRWFTAVWGVLRLEVLGRSLCKPRVW